MSSESRESRGQSEPATGAAPQRVRADGWSDRADAKPKRKKFPGPAGANELLRITMTRDAYSQLTAHAKESLEAEICGVLVGDLFEDEEGLFVSVEAIVRGSAAREGSTHVTFTQETWSRIHEQIDQKYPKRRIVGWYHSHPGFGVEFSEMDLFIQRNFFSNVGQIAFVIDPLGGQEAILVNREGASVPVSRFWVDGRERRCHRAATGSEADGPTEPAATSAAVEKALKAMDDRISQLVQVLDGQVASTHRLLLTLAMAVALIFCLYIGYQIYSVYANQNRPPELQSFAPVPVQIGDKSVLLGVGIVKWEVPPGLNAAFLQVERERQAAEQAAGKGATSQPAMAPTTLPAK